MKGLLGKALTFLDQDTSSQNASSRTANSGPAAEGLLARAKTIRQKPESPEGETSTADFLRDKEREIMAELDAILAQNRLTIDDTTMEYQAQSSGSGLPLAINLIAGSILVLLGLLFFWLFNRSESSLVSEERRLATAEGRIIEELRRSAEEELSQKQAEVEEIQHLLSEAEKAKRHLSANLESELSLRESQLKADLESELERERTRLLGEGLSEAVLTARMQAFEEEKHREYATKQAALLSEFEQRLKKETEALNLQMDIYHSTLVAAQREHESLKNALQEELADVRQEAVLAREEAAAQRSEALRELDRMGQEKEEVQLVENRILSLYDQVNSRLRQGDHRGALDQLDLLEDFLANPGTAVIPSVAERKKVEGFLISSLRRLIRSEIAATSSDTPAQTDTSAEELNRALAEAQAMVDLWNQEALKAQEQAQEIERARAREEAQREEALGALEAARAREAALARKEAEERQQVERGLAEASDLFKTGRYQASVERYREALQLLESRASGLGEAASRLVDAGQVLGEAKKPSDVPPVTVSKELSPQDQARIAQAQIQETQRRKVLDRIEGLQSDLAAPAEDTSGASQGSLVSILNTKLLIRQALSTEEVRKTHPDLYKNVDSVFEAYGEERHQAGQEETLRDILALTEKLVLGMPIGDEASMGKERGPSFQLSPSLATAAEDARRRALLAAFLENLKKLLEGAY